MRSIVASTLTVTRRGQTPAVSRQDCCRVTPRARSPSHGGVRPRPCLQKTPVGVRPRPCLDRTRREVEAVRRRGRARVAARAAVEQRASSRPSSIVPTSVRTMWRRNESAVISNAITASRRARPTAPPRTVRTKPRCCVSAGVNARKSCAPSEHAGVVVQRGEVDRARPPERPPRLERRALAPPPDAVAIRPRPRVEAGAEPGRRLLGRVTATSSGSTVFSASAARSAGGPPRTSTETTFASACTPVSVRPATASSLRVP